MKNISNYINEQLSVNSLKPKTINELRTIVYDRVKTYGNSCNLNDINVSEITDMHQLFVNTPKFNGDIQKWDVSHVTNMYGMFRSSKFDQNISKWNVENVINKKLNYQTVLLLWLYLVQTNLISKV